MQTANDLLRIMETANDLLRMYSSCHKSEFHDKTARFGDKLAHFVVFANLTRQLSKRKDLSAHGCHLAWSNLKLNKPSTYDKCYLHFQLLQENLKKTIRPLNTDWFLITLYTTCEECVKAKKLNHSKTCYLKKVPTLTKISYNFIFEAFACLLNADPPV